MSEKSSQFYLISIKPLDKYSNKDIEETLNKALDWYRLNKYTYIAYSTSDVNVWLGRLRSYCEDEGSLFICKLDISKRNGWMSNKFWLWIKEKSN